MNEGKDYFGDERMNFDKIKPDAIGASVRIKITPAYSQGANAYHDNVSIRTNPYVWLTTGSRDWIKGFMSQMPVRSKKT